GAGRPDLKTSPAATPTGRPVAPPAAPLAPPVAGCAAGRRHCSSVWPQAVASVVLQAENTEYPLFQAAAFTAIDLIIKGPLQAHIRFTPGTADVVAGAGKAG